MDYLSVFDAQIDTYFPPSSYYLAQAPYTALTSDLYLVGTTHAQQYVSPDEGTSIMSSYNALGLSLGDTHGRVEYDLAGGIMPPETYSPRRAPATSPRNKQVELSGEEIHQIMEGRPMICPICPQKLRWVRKHDVWRHLASHAGLGRWICCGVPVVDASLLGIDNTSQAHELEYVGGCMKDFSRRDAYKRHLNKKNIGCIGSMAIAKAFMLRRDAHLMQVSIDHFIHYPDVQGLASARLCKPVFYAILPYNMDDSESSPSPLDEVPARSRREAEYSRKGHRSSKDRDRSFMGGSTREFARLLVYQERETIELRKRLDVVTEQLRSETQRADAAESRIKEAVLRWKSINDARIQAQQDVQRTTEELNLYKLQLDNALREIKRAQDIIDSVEAQRLDAEEAAASARSTARKLKEEKVVQIAREEGRREGLEEGLARGRNIGFEEGRAEGYARGRAAASRTRRPFVEDAPESPEDEQSVAEDPSASPPDDYGSRTPSIYSQTLPRRRAGTPGPSAAPEPAKDSEIHPTIVHNVMMSPSHPPVTFPPDGFIPKQDNDSRIRLPPPHELAPPPPTPSPPSSVALQNVPLQDTGDDRPPIRIPPPAADYNDGGMESDSTTGTHRRTRHHRQRSSESLSTTMSQFEILGPPVPTSARSTARERPAVLSAIAEERERSSSVSSPQGANPPRNSRGSSLSPDFAIHVEPPSGPESPQSRIAPMTPHLLSADDLPPPTNEPPSEPAPGQGMPSMSPGVPVVLADGQLPPGFQPIGPPVAPDSFTPMTGHHPSITPQTMYNTSIGSIGPAGVPLPPSIYGGTPSVSGSNVIPGMFPTGEPVVIPHLMPSAGLGAAGAQPGSRYSRSALRDSSSDSDVSSGLGGSMDSLTTPPSRRRDLPGRATPSYATAPIPPNVTYPAPPTPHSTSSRTTAARVPLPPSTAGSMASPGSTMTYPYAQTPYSRSNLAVDAGHTPMNRPRSPAMSSVRGTPLPSQVEPRSSIYDLRGRNEQDFTQANTAANAGPSAARMSAMGSPTVSQVSLAPTSTSTKSKKSKKAKKKSKVASVEEVDEE
ncbi:hypothetical protein IEO21_02098 [Rhodonia placenta]|uniref:C2H2-type domain-containing protein n=1 Tax=Rhodonia placenta TaxID=104341 RepID=A0A8H7P8B7_9APHY|nr:hypothetical protein IEO21_02098 [Postia placenta]